MASHKDLHPLRGVLTEFYPLQRAASHANIRRKPAVQRSLLDQRDGQG